MFFEIFKLGGYPTGIVGFVSLTQMIDEFVDKYSIFNIFKVKHIRSISFQNIHYIAVFIVHNKLFGHFASEFFRVINHHRDDHKFVVYRTIQHSIKINYVNFAVVIQKVVKMTVVMHKAGLVFFKGFDQFCIFKIL